MEHNPAASDPHFSEEVYNRYFDDTGVRVNRLLTGGRKPIFNRRGGAQFGGSSRILSSALLRRDMRIGTKGRLIPKPLDKITARYGDPIFNFLLADSMPVSA